jgi:hypothetical protein
MLSMDEDQTRSRVTELSRGPGANAVAWGTVELDTEVSAWLKHLPARHLATVAFYLDLLARHGPRLRWPHARQVDAKLRKLRFHLDGRAVRIFYWIGPQRRIVLLTVFMQVRIRDNHEIGRARIALKRYQSGWGAPRAEPLPETGRQYAEREEQDG